MTRLLLGIVGSRIRTHGTAGAALHDRGHVGRMLGGRGRRINPLHQLGEAAADEVAALVPLVAVGGSGEGSPAVQLLGGHPLQGRSAAARFRFEGGGCSLSTGSVLLQQRAHQLVQHLQVHVQLGVRNGIHPAAGQAARTRLPRVTIRLEAVESGYLGQAFG